MSGGLWPLLVLYGALDLDFFSESIPNWRLVFVELAQSLRVGVMGVTATFLLW